MLFADFKVHGEVKLATKLLVEKFNAHLPVHNILMFQSPGICRSFARLRMQVYVSEISCCRDAKEHAQSSPSLLHDTETHFSFHFINSYKVSRRKKHRMISQ